MSNEQDIIDSWPDGTQPAQEPLDVEADVAVAETDDTPDAPDVAADQSTDPQEIGRQRCLAAAAAVKISYELNIAYLNSGERQPLEKQYDAIETVFEIVGEHPEVAWDPMTWPFLEFINVTANAILPDAHTWRDQSGDWNHAIGRAIQSAHGERKHLLDPTPPEPEIKELESISELTDQKVTDNQIARIYEWEDERGNPDIRRVKQCKRGEVEAPTQKIFAAQLRGPKRQPHLGAIDSLLGIIAQMREQEEEQPLSV